MRALFGLILAAICVATPAYAQTERRAYYLGHAIENFEFALHEICRPYLFEGEEAGAWVQRRRRAWVSWFPPGGPFTGLTTYLVGGGSAAIVGVGERNGSRECTVKGESADPQLYQAALNRMIADLPFAMTPRISLPTGTGVESLLICAPLDVTPPLGILASAAITNRRHGVFLVSFLQEACPAENLQPEER